MQTGKSLGRGDMIQYIHTDAAHKNPLRRVIPLNLVSEEHHYDKEKYREMLLETAETVLGYFGFDTTIYDTKSIKKKNRKWRDELKQERMRDIQIEKI
jgi:DNA polymerase elongation subunit (family B)